jgi:hypothetical protein
VEISMQLDDLLGDKRQGIARALGFLTEEELAILGGVKLSTVEAWRKRQQGPRHILFGNLPLYPMGEVQTFLEGLYSKVEGRPKSRRHILDAL